MLHKKVFSLRVYISVKNILTRVQQLKHGHLLQDPPWLNNALTKFQIQYLEHTKNSKLKMYTAEIVKHKYCQNLIKMG